MHHKHNRSSVIWCFYTYNRLKTIQIHNPLTALLRPNEFVKLMWVHRTIKTLIHNTYTISTQYLHTIYTQYLQKTASCPRCSRSLTPPKGAWPSWRWSWRPAVCCPPCRHQTPPTPSSAGRGINFSWAALHSTHPSPAEMLCMSMFRPGWRRSWCV